MPFLEILNGPQVGEKTVIAQDTFFIGRDGNNHLVLAERTVSRKHAVINKVGENWSISNLKSLKGILINGVQTEEATLQEGDELALGAVRLRFYAHDTVPDTVAEPGKNKKVLGSLLLLIVLALIGGGVYLFWPSHKSSHQTKSPEKSPLALDEFMDQQDETSRAIAAHYLKGVALFNADKNIAGAKKEWEEVLRLDPQRKTLFAQKAAKLLENLSK